ncbi:MAG: RNA polymerase sigma-70 factor [Sphingobacteriales bacterium]|nr:MAG: RNA polymerase sigma-70 factor [Sphingobacteriales bacterium]
MEDPAADKSLNPAETEKLFKQLFLDYYDRLRYYAFTIIKDENNAEEIIQNVFCRLWEKRDEIRIKQATQAYLYRSVFNESMNLMKKEKLRTAYQAATSKQEDGIDAQNPDLKKMSAIAGEVVNSLPEQCRTIFQLSRMEDLKYREIAERLGISVKTVETQMSKALKILREKLADYLPLLFFCFMNLKK